MKVFTAGLLVLLGFNLVMLIWSLLEWVWTRTRKASWRTATQVLLPPAGTRQPTIIMVHGFGGSPLDLKPLAEALRDRGFKVVVPVVPGQTAEAFAYRRYRYSPRHYLDWIEKIVAMETGDYNERPYLVGFSMGATLATIAAARGLPGRLVLLAPFYRLAWADRLVGRSAALVRFVAPVIPRLFKGRINHTEGRRAYRLGTYLVSLMGYLHLRELAHRAALGAPAITIPTLVFIAGDDSVAESSSARALFKVHPSATVEVCRMSDHVVLYDVDRQAVVERVARFFESPWSALYAGGDVVSSQNSRKSSLSHPQV